MHKAKPVLAVLALLTCIAPVRPLTSDFSEFAEKPTRLRMKWPTRTIRVSISTSLNSSTGTAIRAESDVSGAVRRALNRWSTAAGIKFEQSSSPLQSISPLSGGDGISLITIADTPENYSMFGDSDNPARTRVFYDPETSEINEADIAINPQPISSDGNPLQFSTDGSPGTYDLESTLTHEIGHLLGLEHSNVLGSTMQPRQCLNGTYKLPALTERTLSEDDRARISSLYGAADDRGAIEGKLINNLVAGSSNPVKGAHVWVEETTSGRVVASAVTSSNGNYRIESLPAGQYRVLTEYVEGQRPFRSSEIASQARVNVNSTNTINFVMVPPQSSAPQLKPRLIGTNGDLSTTPVPVEAGKRLTIYVAGEGVDQVPISGISVTSPFMTVDTDSLSLQQFGTSFPAISFDVVVAPNASFGDYSIRLQSNSGEVAYVAGGLTVDPGVNLADSNPADDAAFFINQHYRDFLGTEADQKRLAASVDELTSCGSDLDCLRSRRVDVSAAFVETEFQDMWLFIYRLYKASLGRRPTLAEFNNDRLQIASHKADFENGKHAFTQAFVLRREFLKRYPTSLKPGELVDRLLLSVLQASDVDLSAERRNLTNDVTSLGRVEIIERIANDASFAKKQNPQALVVMHYFGYFRREPDEAGYNLWLNSLNGELPNRATRRALTCGFITSPEYQARFGMFLTRTNRDCSL